MCNPSDVICLTLAWLIERSELILLITLSLAAVYAAWLDGYDKGQKSGNRTGFRAGFINGIMHHIHIRAFNAADFPTQYQQDEYLLEAQKLITQRLNPELPQPLRSPQRR